MSQGPQRSYVEMRSTGLHCFLQPQKDSLLFSGGMTEDRRGRRRSGSDAGDQFRVADLRGGTTFERSYGQSSPDQSR
jgi:hypothetical protein